MHITKRSQSDKATYYMTPMELYDIMAKIKLKRQ